MILLIKGRVLPLDGLNFFALSIIVTALLHSYQSKVFGIIGGWLPNTHRQNLSELPGKPRDLV
jgi:hypothetical protein